MTTAPTTTELTEHRIKTLKGVDVGLGAADPLVDVARKLEAQYPGHLILVQAGKFLHGFNRTAYALHVLKQYKLKLAGTTAAPHIRAGFPVGNFKRRLWPMVEEFGIPYVVALGTQQDGHTIYVGSHGTANAQVLASVSDEIVHQVIEDLRNRGELNKAGAQKLLANPDTPPLTTKNSVAHTSIAATHLAVGFGDLSGAVIKPLSISTKRLFSFLGAPSMGRPSGRAERFCRCSTGSPTRSALPTRLATGKQFIQRTGAHQ